MGTGRFDEHTHKFDLLLSIQYNASAADQDQWRQAFQRASRLLYDATDGKHQLGTIFVCLNSLGGDRADAWILGTGGTSHSPPAALGSSGDQMTLHVQERFHPLVIVHELGHYIYGLYDEYLHADGSEDGKCLGHTETFLPIGAACIMEASNRDGERYDPQTQTWTPGVISEFCGSAEHTTDNQQHLINHQSCWGTMVSRYEDLAPAPTAAVEAPPTATRINWVVLDQAQRFVLLLDHSASMTTPKMSEAKFGAHWWADALLSTDALAVVSFANTATVNLALQTLSDAQRTAAHTAIDSITPAGEASIGAGLRAALQEIESSGTQSVRESIVLVSTGQHQIPPHPNEVIPALVARGVRVHVIAIHPVRNPTLLRNIAIKTGGTYHVA